MTARWAATSRDSKMNAPNTAATRNRSGSRFANWPKVWTSWSRATNDGWSVRAWTTRPWSRASAGRGRHQGSRLAAVGRVQRQLLVRCGRQGLGERRRCEHDAELGGARHHLLLGAGRPEVLGGQPAAGDADRLPARRAEQLDRVARLQVEVVAEVLFDQHLPVTREPPLPQRDLADLGLTAIRKGHDPAEQRVVPDTGAEILLGAGRDERCARQAGRIAGDRVDVRAAEHDVGQALGAVRSRERVPQVPVRVTGGDEHRDADGDHDHDRGELGSLAPHVPAQLARKDAAHHSSSSASTGCATRSSLAIHARVQAHDPVGHAGDRRVVRHQQHRVVTFAGEVTQHAEHLPARVQIEAAGRLVAQHQRRFLHQRPGDRDPLLLAARQLRREPVDDLRQPDPRQRRPAAGFGVACR